MGYIEDVKNLLKKEEATYPELLDILIGLEREHATLTTKIKMGLREDMRSLTADMKNVWRIENIATRLRVKIEKKLNE